jgi:serine phosphatase RsbU (regulator of sigma subunit)
MLSSNWFLFILVNRHKKLYNFFMEINIAVAKINKYSVSESGDTLEIVERPNGGVSVVLADGQTSGRGAKSISSLVVRKVIALLAEGVRDGAAARAASDALYTERKGKVSACLDILSVDLQTNTMVISRNNPTPIIIARGDIVECIGGDSQPIGTSRNIKPVITEIPLQNGISVVIYTDGIHNAGDRVGEPFDICTLLNSLLEEEVPTAQEIADTILNQAIRLDQNRPNDDMSVMVMRAVADDETDQVRRMAVRLPVPPVL